MGTEVEERRSTGGALAGIAALKANLKKVKDALPATGNFGYLRYLQDGSWVFGKENHELTAFDAKKPRSAENAGDEVAFNPDTIKTGFQCWTDYDKKEKKKNEMLGEVLVPLGHDLPLKHELTDHGWEWKEIISIQGRVMTGKHKGKPISYTTSSRGGLSMMENIIEQLMIQLDEDEAHPVPVIELGKDWYDHSNWGKTYTPAFEIVEFVTMDGMAVEEPPAEEAPKQVEAPKRTRPTAVPDPEPEEAPEVEDAEVVEEAAPVRRRRR